MHIKNISVLLALVFCCIISAQSPKNISPKRKEITTVKKEPLVKDKALITKSKKEVTSQKETPNKTKEEKKQRTIKVKNSITSKMTQYRFWGTYYEPTEFYLTINGKKLKKDDCIECAISTKNSIEIAYHYEFQNGVVTGSKGIDFEIFNNKSSIDITFSWEKEHRLICNNGRAIKSKKGIMKSSCSFI